VTRDNFSAKPSVRQAMRFQPLFINDFSHSARTVFDRFSNVRARVCFRLQDDHPVAFLDDLHKLNASLTGSGNYQGVWDLHCGAEYVDDQRLHNKVGGLKIWRESDQFNIFFYGPRDAGCAEPRKYDAHVSVAVKRAAEYDREAWQLTGRNSCAFALLAEYTLPLILRTLLYSRLVAQTESDDAVREKWACIPIYVTVT